MSVNEIVCTCKLQTRIREVEYFELYDVRAICADKYVLRKGDERTLVTRVSRLIRPSGNSWRMYI